MLPITFEKFVTRRITLNKIIIVNVNFQVLFYGDNSQTVTQTNEVFQYGNGVKFLGYAAKID
jgi:hypothetical protein